jgi:hypothetical protein
MKLLLSLPYASLHGSPPAWSSGACTNQPSCVIVHLRHLVIGTWANGLGSLGAVRAQATPASASSSGKPINGVPAARRGCNASLLASPGPILLLGQPNRGGLFIPCNVGIVSPLAGSGRRVKSRSEIGPHGSPSLVCLRRAGCWAARDVRTYGSAVDCLTSPSLGTHEGRTMMSSPAPTAPVPLTVKALSGEPNRRRAGPWEVRLREVGRLPANHRVCSCRECGEHGGGWPIRVEGERQGRRIDGIQSVDCDAASRLLKLMKQPRLVLKGGSARSSEPVLLLA